MYEVFVMKDYFDSFNHSKALMTIDFHPAVYDKIAIRDSVYLVHAISDDKGRIGVVKEN